MPCGDNYMKCGYDFGPGCLCPQEDGTITDGCSYKFKKVDEGGAPVTDSMAR